MKLVATGSLSNLSFLIVRLITLVCSLVITLRRSMVNLSPGQMILCSKI